MTQSADRERDLSRKRWEEPGTMENGSVQARFVPVAVRWKCTYRIRAPDAGQFA